MKRLMIRMDVANCMEALKYYRELFHGEVLTVIRQEDDPAVVSQAEMKISDDVTLFFRDAAEPLPVYRGFSMKIEVENQEEMMRFYHCLRKNGMVLHPLEKTFRGTQHGYVEDRYGIRWELEYETP